MDLPTINGTTESKVKNFWSRPEGTTGMMAIGLLGLGAYFLLMAVGPSILAALTLATAIVGKTIVLTVGCAVLAALLYILTNRKFLTLCGYIFKSAMRKVTQLFVEIDPIGIMKNYIDDLRSQKETIDNNKSKLRGQLTICENQIATNEKKRADAMSMAKVAQEKGNAGVFTLNARNAGRLEKSNVTLSQMHDKMKLLYRAICKYSEACDLVIQDMAAEVDVKSQERKALLAGYGAMRSVMAILNGNGDKKELFDQAMEFVVEDYGRKMGEITDFMDASKSFIDGLDLQNGVYEAEAMKQLEAWEQKADGLLVDKRLIQESVPMSLKGAVREPVTIEGDYSKFFEKK